MKRDLWGSIATSHEFHENSPLSFQVLIKMLQTPDLLSSCFKILLKTISALLLAENIHLPDSLTKEAIERVTKTSYWRNTRVQVP